MERTVCFLIINPRPPQTQVSNQARLETMKDGPRSRGENILVEEVDKGARKAGAKLHELRYVCIAPGRPVAGPQGRHGPPLRETRRPENTKK